MKRTCEFESVFKETLAHFTNDKEVIIKLWQDIEKHYRRSSRHYHNLAHLDHLITVLKRVETEIQDWNIMVLAIAYHDIIYNISRSDNEEKSAKHAENILQRLLSREKQNLLSRFIVATKTHSRSENRDINYFTDADLSILGAKADDYALYTKQIRKEYGLYPMFVYKPGRSKVIRHFLSMDAIFKTDFFYRELEEQARDNLRKELSELS